MKSNQKTKRKKQVKPIILSVFYLSLHLLPPFSCCSHFICACVYMHIPSYESIRGEASIHFISKTKKIKKPF